MDDVPQGGATVIPGIHVHVPSVKGSVLVVHNARGVISSSDVVTIFDDAGQYGSCPIFYGDKWSKREKHLPRFIYLSYDNSALTLHKSGCSQTTRRVLYIFAALTAWLVTKRRTIERNVPEYTGTTIRTHTSA